MKQKTIIVIGGGAAGSFAAINAAAKHRTAQVILLEKSNKLLSKVKVSGGGRCNVTNSCFDTNALVANYPRGGKELRQVFSRFSVQETINWFNDHDVRLKTEADGRMFPVTDDSQTIIDCFLDLFLKYKIDVRIQEEVLSIEKGQDILIVKTNKESYYANSVICSSGGHNQSKHYNFIKAIGHTINEPIPSLFTINLPDSDIKELMGLSVKHATVKVSGLKHFYTGPVLITHWGLSGPAVLKLSAFAAKDFYGLNYNTQILVNWTGNLNEEKVKENLLQHTNEKQQVSGTALFDIPRRLWEYLLSKAEITLNKPWAELGKKQINKLSQILTSDTYQMKGKTTFKEEFVTCGGVNLKEVDFKTMQSKILPGLFFCGEVLDIDGITGGFNFQSAWSTAWVAANNVS